MKITPQNIHATAIKFTFEQATMGVLIGGQSGSGKSLLALQILHATNMNWQKAELISDDQTMISLDGDMLIANPPSSIAGKLELRGYGIIENLTFQKDVKIDFWAELIDGNKINRMPEKSRVEILGKSIPKILLPKDDFNHGILLLNYHCLAHHAVE